MCESIGNPATFGTRPFSLVTHWPAAACQPCATYIIAVAAQSTTYATSARPTPFFAPFSRKSTCHMFAISAVRSGSGYGVTIRASSGINPAGSQSGTHVAISPA